VQRAILDRTLTTDLGISLLDEPLAALDAQTREYVQFEVQRIWLQTEKTVVYVTHQSGQATYLEDQGIVISARSGRVKHTRGQSGKAGVLRKPLRRS
jgi:NitT/TauT family transport system ATP-binding protein